MAKSTYQQEAERRTNDLLRVHNPTDNDVVVEWDRANGAKVFRVPANSDAVLIRYIAEKYIREMYQKIVNSKASKAIASENKKRIEKGMAEMDKTLKTGEQMSFEQKLYNLATEEQKKIISLLYVGVENEYGLDRITTEEKTTSGQSFDELLSDVQTEKKTPGKKQVKSNSKNTFTCDECGFSTKYRVALAGHKKSHEKDKK